MGPMAEYRNVLLLGAALITQYGLGVQLPYMPTIEISWVQNTEQPPTISGWLDENLLSKPLNEGGVGENSWTDRVFEL